MKLYLVCGTDCSNGFSNGFGQSITKIANYDVHVSVAPRGLAVGCEWHTFATWRERWEQIAGENGIDPDSIRDKAENLLEQYKEVGDSILVDV